MSKASRLKELKDRFIDSMRDAAMVLSKTPSEITRDEYTRTTVDHDFTDRLNKEELVELGGFKVARGTIFQKSKEELENEQLEELIESYRDYVSELGLTPSLKIMEEWGYNSRFINKKLGSVRKLYDVVSERYPDITNDLVNDTIFTKEYKREVKTKVKNSKVFFVSTAVSGKEVNLPSLLSVQSYLKLRKGELIILPSEDAASKSSIFNYELDRRLKDAIFVSEDLYLNKNIHLSSIRVSAKQINPLTGLERLAQSKGSAILASPKQYLKFVSTSNTKLPHALMTTGCITVGDYSTDLYMSKRTSYIAEFDHVIGGLIVEIKDDSTYHFRQVQFDKDGSFYDLGVKYFPNGKTEKVRETVCVLGDTHVGSHDFEVDKALTQIVSMVNAKEIIVHDLFDNRFNNHHNSHRPVTQANLARKGLTSLLKEGMLTKAWLDSWTEKVSKITVVPSNHNEALDRYIDEGRWLYDPENLYDSLLLVRAKMDGKNPLKVLIEDLCNFKYKSQVEWLDRDEDYLVYGIVNDAHGDKGANGSKGSLSSIEKSYYKATIGHSHTAGILRNIYQVGTSSRLKLSYNSGPSSWTHTMCIQYPNGQRQLVNMIKNKQGQIEFKL